MYIHRFLDDDTNIRKAWLVFSCLAAVSFYPPHVTYYLLQLFNSAFLLSNPPSDS